MDCDLSFLQGEGTSSPVSRKEESVMKIDEGCEEEESKQKDNRMVSYHSSYYIKSFIYFFQ